MNLKTLSNTAFATANTPFSFGVGFINLSAGTLVVEGSSVAGSGYTDLLSIPTNEGLSVDGRLPNYIRVKTAANLTMVGN